MVDSRSRAVRGEGGRIGVSKGAKLGKESTNAHREMHETSLLRVTR